MKKFIGFLVAVSMLAAIIGACAKPPPPPPPPTAPQRPAWTMVEPEKEGNRMVFIGISTLNATEQGGRAAAMRNAAENVVKYLGTAAESKFEQARTSFGLSSQTVDPTQATRSFQRQLSANVARRLKASHWYMERERDATGKRGYKVFVKTLIPISEINASFKKTANDNAKKAQDDARKAMTDQAKKQANDAANFWKNMSKQGLVPTN